MSFYYPRRERDQIALTARGVLSEPGHPLAFPALQACTTQTAYGVLLGLRAGDVVTGVEVRVGVAAVGTDPTLARFGLADSAGTMLAVSADRKAAANWAVGAQRHALSAPYTVTADGGYFACWVINGTWSNTQPTILRNANQAAAMTASGSGVIPSFKWVGQTDLPAVASPLTITAALDIGFYVALY